MQTKRLMSNAPLASTG